MVMHECGTELTLVSLFDGIGGFPLAFQGVARTVATCEIDPAAAGVAADHFPEAKAFTDVTELTAGEVLAAGFCPTCGILTAGWPCQDVSNAGKRAGLNEGDRSSLAWEVVRLAAELKPRWLVLENVPGLLSDKGEFVDPRCVCGWTGGRRGVRLCDELGAQGRQSEVVLGDRGDRNVGQGTGSSANHEAGVRRIDQTSAPGDGEVVRGTRMGGHGGEGRSHVDQDSSASPAEEGSGDAGSPSDGDPESADSGRWSGGPMDSRRGRTVRDDPQNSSGSESQGPGGDHGSPADTGAICCPACGRPMGDRPGQSVLRYGMGTVLGALAHIGFRWAWRILDAQHFGVPQRRRRVVIVGCLGDGAAPAAVLLEPDGSEGHPAQSGEPRTIASALTRNGVGGGGGADDNAGQVNHLIAYQQQGTNVGPMGALRRGNGNETGGVPFLATTITARERKGPDSGMTSGNIVGFDAAQITSGENRSNPRPGDPQPTLAATGAPHVAYALRADPGGIGQGHNTNYVPLGGEVTHALTAEGSDASEDGTGRGTPIEAFGHANGMDEQASESPTPTLRAGHGVGGGSVATTAAVRRLTPVECERLQGYPDGWTATSGGRAQSDSARYRQLGNSIAVPVFAWVARRLACVHANDLPDTIDQ